MKLFAMSVRVVLGLLLLSMAPFAAAYPPPLPPPSRWIPLPSAQVEVDGLPWYKANDSQFIRLPVSRKATYPKAVWDLAQDSTGGRIRFRTDSTALAVRLEYPHPPDMPNMHAFGQSGVSLYVGKVYWATAIADKTAKRGKTFEYVYFNFGDAPREEREITLYLPLYLGVKVLAIGVDEAAVIRPPLPFALLKPVVFYGTSITQGCCASHPGMSYDALMGRRLNLDYVNLGFSGAGNYEPALAHAVADIDASCYVLDGSNIASAEELRKVLAPFIQVIREKHPGTPILVSSPLYASWDLMWKVHKESDESRRVLMRNVVSGLIAQGDRNLQFVEGTDLLSSMQGDGLTDGGHLNDLGATWVADGYTRRIATVLGLNPER